MYLSISDRIPPYPAISRRIPPYPALSCPILPASRRAARPLSALRPQSATDPCSSGNFLYIVNDRRVSPNIAQYRAISRNIAQYRDTSAAAPPGASCPPQAPKILAIFGVFRRRNRARSRRYRKPSQIIEFYRILSHNIAKYRGDDIVKNPG